MALLLGKGAQKVPTVITPTPSLLQGAEASFRLNSVSLFL